MATHSFQKVVSAKDCCKKDENLKKSSIGNLTVYTCKICKCRHRILKVEPGMLGEMLKEKYGGKNV